MLNYVNAGFKGLLAENNILVAHAVDGPDSISEPSLEQQTFKMLLSSRKPQVCFMLFY